MPKQFTQTAILINSKNKCMLYFCFLFFVFVFMFYAPLLINDDEKIINSLLYPIKENNTIYYVCFIIAVLNIIMFSHSKTYIITEFSVDEKEMKDFKKIMQEENKKTNKQQFYVP